MRAILLLLAWLLPQLTFALTGRLSQQAGVTVVHLWGSPVERGFAHGALLALPITELIDDYAIPTIGAGQYPAALAGFALTATVPEALRQEAEGLVQGVRSQGKGHLRALNRPLTVDDVLLVNALTDLVALGCSSVSTSGPKASAPVLVRNLDWSTAPPLLRNQVVFAIEPEDRAHQRVVSVAFAGYLGCLSCFNEAGVGLFFNMGYGDGAAGPAALLGGFTPANLLLRELIARQGGLDDVLTGLKRARHAGSYLVHLIDRESPAVVAEIQATGQAVRHAPDDPSVRPGVLIATNHLRALEGPSSCRRYREAKEAARKGALDEATLFSLAERLALDQVVYTLSYQPRSRALRLKLRAPGKTMAASEAPVMLTWETLFPPRP